MELKFLKKKERVYLHRLTTMAWVHSVLYSIYKQLDICIAPSCLNTLHRFYTPQWGALCIYIVRIRWSLFVSKLFSDYKTCVLTGGG